MVAAVLEHPASVLTERSGNGKIIDPETRRLRVAIVGAGIVGASIAYQLSSRDVGVTVIEGATPGSGASGHSFAWINAFGKFPDSYHDLNRRSMDAWYRLEKTIGEVGLRWGGHLRWELSKKGAEELERLVTRLQGLGYPARMTDVDEMHRMEPGLAAGPVSAAALGEIEGHVDTQMAVDACLARASERGAVVRTGTPVTEMELDSDEAGSHRVRNIGTPGGQIECDVVVVAAGVGTTQVAALAGVKIPQHESPGVVVRTDPWHQLLQTVSVLYTPSVDTAVPEIHLRQMADGTLMIGEGSQESETRDDSPRHAERLVERAISYLPALEGAAAVPMPVGYRPMPADGLPVIGFTPAVPNMYIALMHSGATLAPLVGELATLEIVDGVRVQMLEPYRPERFSGAV